jgi:hypothetical protein
MADRNVQAPPEFIRQNIAWPDLLKQADFHGLQPHVIRHWGQDDTVPRDIRDNLRREARVIAHRNLALTATLVEVLTLLECHGIPAIPFKGPALAARVYGDISRRQFRDLDIFVRQADIVAAHRILVASGYGGRFPAETYQRRVFLRSQNQLVLRKGPDVHLELHWTVRLGRFCVPISVDDLLRRADRISLGGKEFADLSAEDLLILLCIHGANHEWRRISWICDIVALIESTREQVSWDVVRSRACAAGAGRMVCLGLRLANDLFSARLPQSVHEWIGTDVVARSLATRICRRHHVDQAEPPTVFARLRFHVAVRERWSNKVRDVLWLGLLPNSEDCAVLRLPSMLAFIYFFVRPARLIFYYGLKRA